MTITISCLSVGVRWSGPSLLQAVHRPHSSTSGTVVTPSSLVTSNHKIHLYMLYHVQEHIYSLIYMQYIFVIMALQFQ